MKNRAVFFLSAFLLVLVACGNSGSSTDPSLIERVDPYFKPLVKDREFSGVVMVMEGEDILLSRAYSMADFETAKAHSIDSSFAIASLSKTFTAAAIHVLVKRGQLQYSDRLSEYIPDFPLGKEITLEMLLLHQSGLAEEYQLPGYLERRYEPISLREQVRRIGAGDFQFDPGTDGAYSNSGYIILARVVEIVSARAFEDFLENEIFEPAGMRTTAVDWTDGITTPSYLPGLPPKMIERTSRESHPSHQLGASEVRSTAMDLINWLRYVNGGKLIDVTALDYPYGWGKREYFGRRALEQSGITSGFVSAMVFFPDENLYVVVLSNIRAGRPQARAHIDIAGYAMGEEVSPLNSIEYTNDASIDFQQLVGRYAFPGVGPIVVSSAGDVLKFEWEGFDLSSYLYPLKNGRFWNKLDGVEIGFEASGIETASTMIWSPNADETRAERISQ